LPVRTAGGALAGRVRGQHAEARHRGALEIHGIAQAARQAVGGEGRQVAAVETLAERVGGGGDRSDRAVFAAHGHLAEVALQADHRAAAEQGRIRGAGVERDAGFDVEDGLQAIAQVFGAAEAQAAARLVARVDDGAALFARCVGVLDGDGRVHDAVDGDVGLRVREQRKGRDQRGGQGFVHCMKISNKVTKDRVGLLANSRVQRSYRSNISS
jgi:hypothetical protein